MVTGLLQAIHMQTWLESTLRSIGPASRVDSCGIEFYYCRTPTSIILFDDIKTVFYVEHLNILTIIQMTLNHIRSHIVQGPDKKVLK
jgi:hypothetical protein